MTVEIRGLEELEEELRGLAEHLEAEGGELSMKALLTDEFMAAYSTYESLDAFFERSSWDRVRS